MTNDKLSWKTRLRLFWDVATTGTYDHRDYKTIHEEEQWELCEQRRKELESTCRPRRAYTYNDPMDEQ